ncbi:MAG: hypothetical protein IKX00_01205 [Bacilli bacterium]|nr:hypothetical protein [Bacilli bacterium]
MKKLRIMILLIILSFSFFLMQYLKKRNYELSYKIKKYNITEKYIKNDKKYYVTIKYKDDEYFYIIDSKYSRKRKLVDKIKFVSNDNYKCLSISFNDEKQTPSCIGKDGYISYRSLDEDMEKKLDKKLYKYHKNDVQKDYKNMNIYTLNNKKIMMWNYHGFYYLTNDKFKEIKLFDNDTYNASLTGQINNYLIFPNYDETYEYKTMKILNVDNLKEKTLKLNDNLSEDSYVLGTNDKSIFYYDRKHHQEFEFVPHKSKYRLVDNYIYENGNKVDKSEIYLANNDAKFKYDVTYTYKLIDGNLYRYNKYNNYREKITNFDKEVKELVKEDDEEVYFIVDNKLYVYSDKYGHSLILEYFELNFNYKNIFYIFN